MGFWDFASNHPVALFFCIMAVGWALHNVGMGLRGKSGKCCDDGCCKKND